MFEQSLVDSAVSGGRGMSGRILSRRGSIVATSIGVQVGLLVALVAGPLIYPATLPKSAMRPRVESISLQKKPVVRVEVKPRQMVVSSNAPALPGRTVQVEMAPVSRVRASGSTGNAVDSPLLPLGGPGMAGPVGPGLALEIGPGGGPVVSVATARPAKSSEPFQVSKGVMAGLLLSRIQPVYPRIAVAAHQEGTVIVTAVIDKDGRIVGAKAISGPTMLQGAAVDAVREARYRPFLLNGEPTEVLTTVTVNFRLGGA